MDHIRKLLTKVATMKNSKLDTKIRNTTTMAISLTLSKKRDKMNTSAYSPFSIRAAVRGGPDFQLKPIAEVTDG